MSRAEAALVLNGDGTGIGCQTRDPPCPAAPQHRKGNCLSPQSTAVRYTLISLGWVMGKDISTKRQSNLLFSLGLSTVKGEVESTKLS